MKFFSSYFPLQNRQSVIYCLCMTTKYGKPKKSYGSFVSNKDPELLKKSQKLRLVYMYLSTLTFAVTLFLPQEWATKAKEILALQTAYVILACVLIVISVIASYGAARGCNVAKPISEKYKPKAGFENATFASQEWFMYLHIVFAAAEIGLIIYGFGAWGLVAAVLSCAGAAFSFLSRMAAYSALKDGLDYIPPAESAQTQAEEDTEKAEEPKASNQAPEKEQSDE